MREYFDFSLPLTGNGLMTTVRLAVGGLAAAAGLNVDDAEDFKVCITESLLIFKRNGAVSATAHCIIDEGLEVTLFSESADDVKAEESAENEISFALLGALVDEVNFERENGVVTGVTLVKKSV